MKKILFIILTLLLSSCYWDNDLNEYRQYSYSRQYIYFWYCNHELFANVDTVQLIGQLESKYSTEIHYVNRSCKVYNDTIYVEKKSTYPLHYIYKGKIMINHIEHGVNIILQ